MNSLIYQDVEGAIEPDAWQHVSGLAFTGPPISFSFFLSDLILWFLVAGYDVSMIKKYTQKFLLYFQP
jgi:hypothetical protein